MTTSRFVSILAVLVCVASITLNAGAEPAGGKGSVKGKVIKGDGTPAAGATVRLVSPPERKTTPGDARDAGPDRRKKARAADQPAAAQVTADGSGEFTLADVPAGRYVLAARLKGTGAARQPVSVNAGGLANVTLTLRGGGERNRPGKRGGDDRDDAKADRKRAKAAKKQRAQ